MTTQNNPTTILVQNIETFETIIVLPNDDAFDAWLDDSTRLVQFGIVSLESDPEGEHAAVALVAPTTGPDFEMDMTTGEMEPVEKIDPNVELECKLDIMMEINNADEEFLLALEVQNAVADEESTIIEAQINADKLEGMEDFLEDSEVERSANKVEAADEATIAAPKNPRGSMFDHSANRNRPTKSKKSKAKNTTTKTAKGGKMKAHEILVALIQSNPGISRTDVFQDPGLRVKLLSSAVMQKIANGDKLEVKRWNRRLNRFIRQMRRDGTDIQIERKGRVAHYTIGTPSGQLEIPFTPAAEARNSSIIGNVASDEELAAPVKIDFRRASEPDNVELSFEDLLSTLDDEAVAPVTK